MIKEMKLFRTLFIVLITQACLNAQAFRYTPYPTIWVPGTTSNSNFRFGMVTDEKYTGYDEIMSTNISSYVDKTTETIMRKENTYHYPLGWVLAHTLSSKTVLGSLDSTQLSYIYDENVKADSARDFENRASSATVSRFFPT